MRLAFDIDGCVADFTSAYGDLLEQCAGGCILPYGWKTDPEFPNTWNWEVPYGFTPLQVQTAWNYIKTSESFWQDLEPLASADTFAQLNRLSKVHDVYFLTNRMGTNAKQQTEEFLIRNGVKRPTVILSGNKVPFATSVGGLDFFIDDKQETVEEFMLAHVAQHLFIKDTPYNRVQRDLEANGVRRVPSVEAALREVELWQEKRPVGRPRKTSSSI